jgi:PAS domain S-box-containing protein
MLEPPSETRTRAEAALEEVSHLLVSSSEVEMRDVLRILGEAVDADCAYLVTAEWGAEHGPPHRAPVALWHRDGSEGERRWLRAQPPSPQEPQPAVSEAHRSPASYFVWHRERDGAPAGVALPILAEHDRFVGYLGIEHASLGEGTLREYSRVLALVGDLLASYYSRVFAERALRESEERWRKLVSHHPDPILVTAGESILYANRAAARLLGAGCPEDLLAYHLPDFLPTEQTEAIELRQSAQLRNPTAYPFEHEVVRLDGEERIVEALSVAITFHGRPAIQTVLRDVTERKASEERYRTFVRTISEGVWRVDVHPPVSVDTEPTAQVRHILEHGVFAECNAMMLDMMGQPEVDEMVGRPLGAALPELPPALFEAFVAGGNRLQNYELTISRPDHTPRHFSVNAVGRADRGQLIRIWGSCSDITARVEMERRMVAVLEEQQDRIGRDLHDTVGQLLTGIRMLGENLVTRLVGAGTADDASVDVARRMNGFAQEAVQRVREICRGLAPPQLLQEGMAFSLEALAAQAAAVAEDVACTFTWDQEAEIEDRDAKLQLYRIAQEAVHNALKHAHPSHIQIHLRSDCNVVVLEVEDDGSGFDVERSLGKSIGLYGMHRRASSIRSTLTIRSGSGGTTVRVRLPSGL